MERSKQERMNELLCKDISETTGTRVSVAYIADGSQLLMIHGFAMLNLGGSLGIALFLEQMHRGIIQGGLDLMNEEARNGYRA